MTPVLGFPDMTTEGSFPLGGAVAVTLITKGVNPFLATAAAVLAGCAAGCSDRAALYKGENSDLTFWVLVMTSCLYHADANGPCQSGAFRQQ